MDNQTDGQRGGWIDRRTDGLRDGWMGRRTDVWMGGREMEGRTEEQTGERSIGRMDQRMGTLLDASSLLYNWVSPSVAW